MKFQTFTAEKLVTPYAEKLEYQFSEGDEESSQLSMLSKLELSDSMHRELISYSQSRKIEFLSTGFDRESVEYLSHLGIQRIKIPSGEITNLPYLRVIGRMKKEVILSTGMSTLDEVGKALEVLMGEGTNLGSITVLHCTSQYPTPIEDVNLRAMTLINETFGVKVGYSDHTIGCLTATCAVALGAQVIEKHITLNKNDLGPDHKSSLEPKEFAEFVSQIRKTETLLGSKEKKPTQIELQSLKQVRKSLVAISDIKKGEIFTPENVGVKRPGVGISPMKWDLVIGTIASRDFFRDEMIF